MKTLISLILILAFVSIVGQTDNLPRYRIEGYHSYTWDYFEELPYTVIGEMCRNETEGYACDTRIANTQDFWVVNRIVDFELDLVGQVWKNDTGDCWLFIWQPYHIDGHPHPLVQQWVECPEIAYFNDGINP